MFARNELGVALSGFLALRFCRSQSERLCTPKTWLEHCVMRGKVAMFSVGREVKMEIPDRCFRSRPLAQLEPIHETCHLLPMPKERNPLHLSFFADCFFPMNAGLPGGHSSLLSPMAKS